MLKNIYMSAGNQLSIIYLQLFMKKCFFITLFATIYVAAQDFSKPKKNVDILSLGIDDFRGKYGKKYASQGEKHYRKLVLQKNKKKINDHNKNEKRSYDLGENQYLDIDQQEFRAFYLGLLPADDKTRQLARDYEELSRIEAQNCDCNTSNALKKMELVGKIAKNKQYASNKIYDIQAGKKKIKDQINKQILQLQNANPLASSIETLSGTADPTAPSATVTASSSLAGTEVPILPDSITPVGVSVSGPGGQTDPLKSNGKPVTGNGNGNGKGRLLQTNTTNATAGLVDVDWSDKTGYVKTQGACGACYAFAAVGAFESALAIKIFGGLHVAFSVQQIIDCTVLPTQNGCSGGQIEYAYSHIQTNGLTTNYQYPYVSGQYPASNTTNGTNTTIDYMNYTGYSRACRFWTGYYKIASYNGPFYSDCVEVRKKLQERPISTMNSHLL